MSSHFQITEMALSSNAAHVTPTAALTTAIGASPTAYGVSPTATTRFQFYFQNIIL